MLYRISTVGKIRFNTVGASTVFQVGDSEQITLFSDTLAVQREKAIFVQNEFNFNEYAIFSRPLVQPVIQERLRMTRINECPSISVHYIKVFLLSSSSHVHIGSSQKLLAQSRILNIRHLLRERPE